MRSKRVIYFVSVAFIVSMCGKPDAKFEWKTSHTEFSDASFEELHVNGITLLDSSVLKNPAVISAVDGLLLLSDTYYLNQLRVIDGASGQLLREGLPPGSDEGEVLSVWRFVRSNDSRSIHAYDLTQNKLVLVNIDSIGRSPKYSFTSELHLGGASELINTSCVQQLDETTFVASVMNDRSRLTVFQSNLSGFKFIGDMPENVRHDPPKVFGHAFRSEIISKGDSVVSAFFFSDVIEAYRSDGTRLFSIHGPEQFWPIYNSVKLGAFYELEMTNDTRVAYFSIDADQNYIYALFKSAPVRNSIYTFDWTGKPRVKYTLSEDVTIDMLTVDRKTQKMYCLLNSTDPFKKDQQRIIWFDLSR